MKKIKLLVPNFVALIAGMLATLAFAPFHLFPLAIISNAILLMTWLNVSPRRAFVRGFLYGVGLFGTGVYWVYISIHSFGNASVFLATLITAAFIAILATIPASTGYLLNRYFPKTNFAKCVLAFPALWILFEWIRSWIFTGFPWLIIGYSQIDSPLRGYAPIFSVYGASLAVTLTAGLLVHLLITRRKPLSHIVRIAVTVVLIWLAGWVLSYIPWTKPKGAPIKVSLVQGSIPEQLKWSADNVQTTLDRYEKLTSEHWNSQIIVWPESAVPISLQDAQDYLNVFAETALKKNVTFITGVPVLLASGNYYNAVIALGKGQGFYLKRRLVPFGEYVPFDKWLHHVLDILNVPMSNFVPGTGPVKMLNANGINISAFICYEIAFPETVVTHDKDVNILLTVSNDAWFGDSVAQPQHLEMAQMRALEMGRPVLFVSNDGITAIIDSHGKIQARAPQHEPYVLTGFVQPTEGKTPWQYFTMDPILLIAFGLLIQAFVRRNR